MHHFRFSMCLLLLYGAFEIFCLQIIPERARVIYVHKKYIERANLSVRRSSRGGKYVMHLVYVSKEIFGNNASVDVVMYEFLTNEYKPSFIEMHYRFCDLILKDVFFGRILRAVGFDKCPVAVGEHDIKNLTFNEVVPYVWPFEKGKIEVITKLDNVGIVAKGEVVVTFKQTPKNHKF